MVRLDYAVLSDNYYGTYFGNDICVCTKFLPDRISVDTLTSDFTTSLFHITDLSNMTEHVVNSAEFVNLILNNEVYMQHSYDDLIVASSFSKRGYELSCLAKVVGLTDAFCYEDIPDICEKCGIDYDKKKFDNMIDSHMIHVVERPRKFIADQVNLFWGALTKIKSSFNLNKSFISTSKFSDVSSMHKHANIYDLILSCYMNHILWASDNIFYIMFSPWVYEPEHGSSFNYYYLIKFKYTYKFLLELV